MKLSSKLAAAALVFTMAVLWASPASANTVTHDVIHLHFHFVDRHSCPFDISVHESGTFRSADFYDNNGDLYKTLLTAGGGKLTITETAKGTTLTMQNQPYLVFVDFRNGSRGSFTLDGPVFIFTSPGDGAVLLEVGRISFDRHGNITFEAGKHQQTDGDFDAFCAAFG